MNKQNQENTIDLSYDKSPGIRLDSFLASKIDISRSTLAESIKTGDIKVNNLITKPSYKLKPGDKINGFASVTDNSIELKPEHRKLDIIFENDDVIVINKPAGMPVHPGAGNSSGTLVNYLIGYLPSIKSAVNDLNDEYESVRPGIIHRLDKDTSGVLVVAKNARALSSVSKQIKNRKVKKVYLAICQGWPKEERGELRNCIGRSTKNRKLMAEVEEGRGKEAISVYKVLKYLRDKKNNYLSLLEFNIKTGRTHQIRIQSKIAGFPVIGDSFYGGRGNKQISEFHGASRQMLHARSIDFFLPGETKISHFEAPIPTDMQTILDSLDSAPNT